jgi:hypothetical protein
VGEDGVDVSADEGVVRLPQRLLGVGHRGVRLCHATSIACTLRTLDESLLRQLYSTPPPEFVAARNDLVKALRRDKRRDEATALAELRRPGWDDWALNAVASAAAAAVAGFADAAADVRAAQAAAIEGREGPDIRVALRDLRDRSAEVVRGAEAALAGVGRQPGPGEVNARLSEVAASDVAVAQLRAGVLGSGDAAPDDLFADLRPAPAATRPAHPSSKEPKAAERPPVRAKKAAQPPPQTGPDRAELARRKEALVQANRVHAAAVKARHRAGAEVDKATTAVERARAALADAEAALDAARAELEQATTSERDAEAAVNVARSPLEG